MNINIVDLEAVRESSVEEWDAAIKKATKGRWVVFTDGSKMEGVKGEVTRGWFKDSGTKRGGVPVGLKAMAWNGEIAGIEWALRMVGRVPVLILADSRAALQAI